ncbi:MAG: hypothetical protein AAGB01_09800 [Cyanobacteria bacterium P01_F01_bin.42]
MTTSSQDRIASLVAGVVGATCIGAAALLCELFNRFLQSAWISSMWPQYVQIDAAVSSKTPGQIAVSVLLTAIAGFLFGITYRYIRRSDPNPQLRTGAIAAFGLTRALAQIDEGLLLQADIRWMLLLAGESIILIAIAALGLDWIIDRGWIQRLS